MLSRGVVVVTGARHLVNLPEGLSRHHRGQAWAAMYRSGTHVAAGDGAIGLRQVDEMALRLPRGQEGPVQGAARLGLR
jgi:hypothetical protein